MFYCCLCAVSFSRSRVKVAEAFVSFSSRMRCLILVFLLSVLWLCVLLLMYYSLCGCLSVFFIV